MNDFIWAHDKSVYRTFKGNFMNSHNDTNIGSTAEKKVRQNA